MKRSEAILKRPDAIRHKSRLLAGVCLSLCVSGLTACSVPGRSASSATDTSTPTTLHEQLQRTVLQPFDAFSTSSRQLANLSQALCHSAGTQLHPVDAARQVPSPLSLPFTLQQDVEALRAAQNLWKTTALDWATASVFANGPSQKDNRRLRINAWPIRTGLVEKQTRLTVQTAASLDSAELGDKVVHGSAAIQGLPAAEYLLFDVLPAQLAQRETEAGKPGEPFIDSCLTLSAITAYMSQPAITLQLEWQQWPTLQSAMAALATWTPDETAPVPEAYRQLQDKLLNGVLSHVRHLTRYKVGSLYEVSNDPGKLDGLEYHYSRLSVASIKAGIARISAALDADGGMLAAA